MFSVIIIYRTTFFPSDQQGRVHEENPQWTTEMPPGGYREQTRNYKARAKGDSRQDKNIGNHHRTV